MLQEKNDAELPQLKIMTVLNFKSKENAVVAQNLPEVVDHYS